MPKKSMARSAQRHKKVQKNFEVVRQPSLEPEFEAYGQVPAAALLENERDRVMDQVEEPVAVAIRPVLETPESAAPATSSAPKGSAAAKIAARRQSTQRAQQRSAATLITPEHYSYVRKDLLFIGVLALIMFAILIALVFVPGIGR